MAAYFDDKKWEEEIQKSDWYLNIIPQLEEIREEAKKKDKTEIEKYKEEVYRFFEKHLAAQDIALGSEVGNWDTERKPIDTVIVHHTSNLPGMTKERLSAMELIRLYAPSYLNHAEEDVQAKPISSGHIRDKKQVFYPYHWIIRNNGNWEQLLFDNEVGWQAGNWEINCRSVAIVLDNDYENSKPSDLELESIASLIKEKYSSVPKERVFGHREINLKTSCPSNLFLSKESQRGWKEDLLELL